MYKLHSFYVLIKYLGMEGQVIFFFKVYIGFSKTA